MAQRNPNKGLIVIALTKFAHAVVILVATIAAIRLMHKNVPLHVAHWIEIAPVDPENRYIAAFLRKLRVIHTQELQKLSALGFFYTGLFVVEGTGLMLQRRWAEWLTLVATGLFIPVEIVELYREPSIAKVILLILNAVIVAFLAYVLARKKARSPKKS